MTIIQSRYREGLHRVGRSWSVDAVKQVSYHIVVGQDILDPANRTLVAGVAEASIAPGERRLAFIDERVHTLYGRRFVDYFAHHDVALTLVPLPMDETRKHWDSVGSVLDAVERYRLNRRREPIIAIGGGVLTDVVGFAASLFRRGTPYVRIPTTLVGLVDAGVGVKTGVNYHGGKNRIGTYAAATATFLDRRFLATLDRRHLANGLAEVLKLALVKSRPLFDILDRYGSALLDDRLQGSTPELDVAAAAVVDQAVQCMLEELAPNLWESTLERCADYGHTFSPTLEMHALPELLHGEAVNVDMALTTAIAHRRGDLSDEDAHRVRAVMADLGLPLWADVLDQPETLVRALADTVRHRDGQQRLPLPVGIGRHRFVNDVTPDEIAAAVRSMRHLAADRVAA